ncbi:hypothetical protein AB6G92_17230 [Providencia vermicola]|uniref:hypothetical protein n=1 Tax=Providencia vermicola TaxID=333965 RepID=UPI0034DD060E
MNWNIPTLPDKTPIKKPNYKIIFIFFTTIVAAIYTYSVILPAEQKTRLLFIAFPIIALLFFACISFLYIRYQHSVVTCHNWEKEKKITKREWQIWCQSSITSIANVIYTPDKDGTDVFFQDAEAVPMFPDKPRRLFNLLQLDNNFITNLDKQLERQCPNYRCYLSKIYLYDSNNHNSNENLIYEHWQLKPIRSPRYQDIFSVYDDNKQNEAFLIITIQSQAVYSEFISAQLFSTNSQLMSSKDTNVKIERIMEIDIQNIDNEIIKYIDYSGISKKNKFQTWITDLKQDIVDKILITYTERNIEYDQHHPIRSLALSYSKPHPNAFLTYLSLITEISTKTETDQVLIHPNPHGASYAVYIHRS